MHSSCLPLCSHLAEDHNAQLYTLGPDLHTSLARKAGGETWRGYPEQRHNRRTPSNGAVIYGNLCPVMLLLSSWTQKTSVWVCTLVKLSHQSVSYCAYVKYILSGSQLTTFHQRWDVSPKYNILERFIVCLDNPRSKMRTQVPSGVLSLPFIQGTGKVNHLHTSSWATETVSLLGRNPGIQILIY